MIETPAWRNRITGTGEVAPDQLLANPRNWRMHPPSQRDALRGSLSEVGWVQQVLVNTVTGYVVDGHARVEEALSRGEPTVPVLYVELTPEEEAVVLATLDPISAMAAQDDEKLRELLSDMAVTDEGLKRLIDDLAGREAKVGLTEPDAVPDVPDEPYVKPGELWLLGEHRLLCGDSTKAEDVARLMDGELAECMWTDPPYGVDYVGKTKDALTISNDGADSSDAVLTPALKAAPLAPSARFYIAGPPGPRHFDFFDAIRSVGWKLHEELIWAKGTIVLGHSDYHFSHEPILYGWVPGDGRPGRGNHDGTRWYGDHAQASVLEFPKPAANVDHPTAKPVALVARCLENSTRGDDVVYDAFLGSGTTLVASEQLGRRCYAIEIDPRYVQVAIERWQAFTGKEAQRVV